MDAPHVSNRFPLRQVLVAVSALMTWHDVVEMAKRPECGGVAEEVAPRIASVATVESGRDPLVIHVNVPGTSGYVVRPADVDRAVRTATRLVSMGASFDVGLMQINIHQLRGMPLRAAFDACSSLAAGAKHLDEDYRASTEIWRMAHQRYNCGGTSCAPVYAAKVERVRMSILGAGASAVQVEPEPSPAAPPAPAVDPDAPPDWDVWATQEYEEQLEARRADAQARPAAPVQQTTGPSGANPVVQPGSETKESDE